MSSREKNMKSIPKKEWENCPNCKNEGGYPVQVSGRLYVTREMALDAQCPEMEGQLYSDDEWELEQCEFCWTNPKSVYYQKNKLWKK
jgi:hypothetical protein